MTGHVYRYTFIICCCLIFSIPANSQNLCPNPGFEQISGCPTGPGDINLAMPWTDAGAPADLFNFCYVNGVTPGCDDVSVPVNFAGISQAFGGSSYAGFYTKRQTANKRTYLQAPFSSPMTNGQLYKVAASFRRSSASKYATNRIAISFSTSVISQTAGAFIPVIPQIEIPFVLADTSSWTTFSSYYQAVGGEQYITIGNFKSDAATTAFNFNTPVAACNEMNSAAFYYVDGIEVIPITEQIVLTGDTTICTGESTDLTATTNTDGWWSEQSNPADTISAINYTITVSPTDTTTYIFNGITTTETITVYTAAPPAINLVEDTTICQGNTVVLNAGTDGTNYIWSTGQTTEQITVQDSGNYVVTVSNQYCSSTDSSSIHVLPTPELLLPETSSICADNNEFAELDAGPGASYLWLPGGDTTQTITVMNTGNYSVTVTYANGCTRADATMIEQVCAYTLYFPGAFTPNSDGKNDTYYGVGTNYFDYNIKIFNRWGQLVFESSIPGEAGGWNGKYNDVKASEGIYTFLVTYSTELSGGRKKVITEGGYFTLLR